MKKWNTKTGKSGEKIAAKYLQKKGYRVLERNFRTRFGEIDLICQPRKACLPAYAVRRRQVPNLPYIVFVEVKTKTGHGFGEPWEMVNHHKLEQIKKMGYVYLTKNGLHNVSCRIDVVGVWLNSNSKVEKIEHWENVT